MKEKKMISTWGIFWICLFTGWILVSIISAIKDISIIRRLTKVTDPEALKMLLDYIKKDKDE